MQGFKGFDEYWLYVYHGTGNDIETKCLGSYADVLTECDELGAVPIEWSTGYYLDWITDYIDVVTFCVVKAWLPRRRRAKVATITVEYRDGFTDEFELDEKAIRLASPNMDYYQGVLSVVDSMSRLPSVRTVAFRIVKKEG